MTFSKPASIEYMSLIHCNIMWVANYRT